MSRFRPAISRRVPSSSSFAELFLAPGPEVIGQTGDNSYASMFGYDWLLVWDRDDGLLHLYQERNGAWVEVLDDLPPVFGAPAPVGSRRWSLAFDQSARVILAYEDGDGIVRVTRWDPSQNGYVQNVSFAGVDPCVVMDASWSFSIPGSDVLLFYLSPDRQRVLCRVQRDVYAVEYEVWDYGEPVILDRVIALPYRYQVLVADSTGAPLPSVLVSDLYPIVLFEQLDVTATGPSGGAYGEPVIFGSLVEALNVIADGPSGGVYREPIIETQLNEALDITTTGPSAGEYKLVVIAYTLTDEGVDVTATGPSGGTYA